MAIPTMVILTEVAVAQLQRVDGYRGLPMARLPMAMLTMTMLTRDIPTMSIPAMALLTMAILMAILTMGIPAAGTLISWVSSSAWARPTGAPG